MCLEWASAIFLTIHIVLWRFEYLVGVANQLRALSVRVLSVSRISWARTSERVSRCYPHVGLGMLLPIYSAFSEVRVPPGVSLRERYLSRACTLDSHGASP